jgi:hypothetical protein
MLAEIFLQDLEQQRIKHLLEHSNIIYYNIYVDDTIIIYNQTKINPQIINTEFNIQRHCFRLDATQYILFFSSLPPSQHDTYIYHTRHDNTQ